MTSIPNPKARKPTIHPTGKTLRLHWYYNGNQEKMSVGVADDPIGRTLAEQKASEIQRDLISGHYDETKLKYKPRKLGKNPTEISAVELLEKYVAFIFKDKELAPGSKHRYRAVITKLRECLKDKPAHQVNVSTAKDVVATMRESLKGQTVKAYLFIIRACWDWAKGKYHLASDSNPWESCINRVKIQPRQQPKPFAVAELQAIIAAFAANRYYSHYTDFVTFLTNAGCRFGEAVGLRWKHIGADFSTAWIGESISRGHLNQRGTKTGKSRTIPLTPTVRSMLADRCDRFNPQPDDLVFPSPKGSPIDDHNFNNRAWKTVLAECKIEHRSPYKLRHSAISHALANGANPIALAEQTGHNKRVLLEIYAHGIGDNCLLVDISGNFES